MIKLIEPPGATPISQEDLENLIPSHITTREELNEFEQENIDEGINPLFKKYLDINTITSINFICDVHKRMFKNVWKWAGKYRQRVTYIGIDPAQIQPSLKYLLDDVKYWVVNKTYSIDEIATRFHHRLVSIHPFPNGNGRHSRVMADLLLQNLNSKLFSWGKGDLYHETETRTEYIKALNAADNHDYNKLLEFVRS